MERCLDQLGSLDRQLLSRIVLQEYTQTEAATLVGMSVRAVSYKFPLALDRLTEKLIERSLWFYRTNYRTNTSETQLRRRRFELLRLRSIPQYI